MKKRKIVFRILFLILLITTFVIIFWFSSQNGDESGKMSKGLINILLNIFFSKSSNKEEIINILHPIIRKLAHFTIFTLVGIWSMSLLETFNLSKKNKILISVLIGFLYACSDEIHQRFISDRFASPIDVLIDTCGVVFGIIIVIIIIKAVNKRKNIEKNI